MHAETVKPDFSPTKNPHQHKQQTLKHAFFMLMLEPYIELGLINLIPDPCFFDEHLRMQMLNMAQERVKDSPIIEEEFERLKELHRGDFERTIWTLPRASQCAQFRRATPDISDERMEELLDYMEQKRQEDPFTLLQDDVYGKGKGGQLSMMTMTPNFELALFIAQVTGSLIFTDSHFRWNEMKNSQYREGGLVKYDWPELGKLLNDLDYPLNIDPIMTFRLREAGKHGKMRKVLAEVYAVIQDRQDSSMITQITNDLKPRVLKASEDAKKDMEHAKDANGHEIKNANLYTFNAKFEYLIPVGGIVHNNVQRMLLSYGVKNLMRNVPMAIFLDHKLK